MKGTPFRLVLLILLWAGSESIATPQGAPANFDELSRRAAAALQRNPTQAANLYQQALALQPSWAEGWFYLAASLYELKQYPEAEAQELALIYAAKGLPAKEADRLAQRLVADPENALDTLAREELGLNPAELGSPVGAAVSSFLSFAVGALLPLAPWILAPAAQAFVLAIAVTAIALFAVGATLSLFTGRNAVFSGARMLLLGAIAGTVTYGIGHLLSLATH